MIPIVDGLSYADDMEPNVRNVAEVTADIILAREEIRMYSQSIHPYPYLIDQHLDECAR